MTERGALDRQQAAELLGVPAEASRAQVQAAFRRRARDAHPDTSGSEVDRIDLDELGRARDLLLTPPGTAVDPARRLRPASAARLRVTPAARHGTDASGALWSVIVGGFLLLLLALLTVVVIALVSGDDGPVPASAGDCVIVTDDVIATRCDTPGAQRVIAALSGVRECPAGTNGLTVGSVTWCLDPVG